MTLPSEHQHAPPDRPRPTESGTLVAMRATRATRAVRAVRAIVTAAALTGALTLTGCQAADDAVQGAQDAVQSAASNAACSVAQQAVDAVADGAKQAADDIVADPQKARNELQALRDTLATAERGIDGDLKAKVADAKDAVDRLLTQAKDAAQGVEVDTSAVDDAKAELDAAVEDVTTIC